MSAAVSRRPIDIEALLQWAVGRHGRLPFDRIRDQELAFDAGLTAKPRKKPRVTWVEAEACAGAQLGRRPVPALMVPGPDAELVVAAVRRLDPRTAETVLACARARIRPDWMPGVEPRRVERRVSWRKCKRGEKRVRMVWEPCDPEAIRAAREVYRRWHAALGRLAGELGGALDAWHINGFAAPAEPWLMPLAQTA